MIPLTIPLLFSLGSEFMPPLYEGSLLYMPTAPPGMSITEGTRLLQVQDTLLREISGSGARVRHDRPRDSATDNTPMGMVNTTIMLKPRDAMAAGHDVETLQAEMDDDLQFAGFPERLDAADSQPSGHAAHRASRHRSASRFSGRTWMRSSRSAWGSSGR